jgi:serine/threonine protein kinase/predicted Zn-dependent protease
VSVKCPKCNSENPDTQSFCGECGTRIEPSDDTQVYFTKTLETLREELTTGSTFADRYQIIEELGRGGMGKVYRALDNELKEEMALKLIRPDIAKDKKTIERFKSELKLARKISHRNVGRMYELLDDKGTRFITMEYVPGGDLKKFIRRSTQLSVGKAISITKQICDGLSEAHSLGIVHRDLKPNNIMIDDNGNAKIMDFGIARSIKSKGITGSGVMIGTPEYMSPEQAEAKEVDQQSDIYSLGVILYEMVTGRVPFEGDSALSIAMKHKGESPKNPKEFNPQIPDDLSGVILKCLEKSQENRYQSAGEIRSELKKVEQGLPTTSKIEPKKAFTSKEITVTFGLKKLLIPAFVLIIAAAAILLLWHPWSKEKLASLSTDKPIVAILPFENLSKDPSLEGWKYGISQLLITDLAQSKYIYVLDDNTIYGILARLNLSDADKFTSQDLIKICDAGRAQYIVSGSMIKAGKNIIITAKLQQPQSGKLLFAREIKCRDEEEILTKSDDFSLLIKENLNLRDEQIADDFDETIGNITSHSPEAFLYYTEGVKKYLLGRKDESIPFLEKAIEIDPQFAMAYNYLGACYPFGETPSEYLQKAFDLRQFISERERLRIEGGYYQWNFSESEYPKAIAAYQKLLEIYPEDNIGNRRLGIMYSKIEEFDKAREYYKVNIDNNSVNGADYYNMACNYENFGQVDKAIEVIALCAERIPGSLVPSVALARIYLKQQEYDRALEECDKYFLHNPQGELSFRTKGDIYLLMNEWTEAEKHYLELLEKRSVYGRDRLAALYLSQGRFEQAENQLKQGVESIEEGKWRRSNFLRRLGYIYLQSGNYDKALDACDGAWENSGLTGPLRLAIQRRALYSIGLVQLKSKSIDEALQVADRLRALIDAGMNKKAERYHHFLMGLIELERKNYSKAIDLLNTACTLLRPQLHEITYLTCWEHALFYESLASACYQANDLKRAREEYLKIHTLTSGRLYYGDIYAKSFYRLGKIQEQQGNIKEAIAHYEKFLKLWKDADPGIAEVEDARKRLEKINARI